MNTRISGFLVAVFCYIIGTVVASAGISFSESVRRWISDDMVSFAIIVLIWFLSPLPLAIGLAAFRKWRALQGALIGLAGTISFSIAFLWFYINSSPLNLQLGSSGRLVGKLV